MYLNVEVPVLKIILREGRHLYLHGYKCTGALLWDGQFTYHMY